MDSTAIAIYAEDVNAARAWESTQKRPRKTALRISYGSIAVMSSMVPAVALLSCAAIGTYLHWEKIVDTHCRVYNFLPSVSAMIGHHHPERYIWRIAMSLVCFPRLIEGYLYYHFFEMHRHHSHLKSPFNRLNFFTSLCHLIQWVLLLTVSYISAKENYYYHNSSFCLWLVFSTLHMVTFLLMYSKSTLIPTAKKKRTVRLRQWFVMVQVASAFGFVYLAYRHNTYCEPHVYSYLAICEYVIGAVYTGFHVLAAVDFQAYYLCIYV